jgi:hypothetical protein
VQQNNFKYAIFKLNLIRRECQTGGYMKYVVFSLSLFILISCASQATLYPSNDLAEESGVLTATYMNYGLGSGKISIEMPNGELLEGEYSTVDTSTYNFGNVYSTVFDSSGNSQGVSTVNTTSVTGSSPGVATKYPSNQLHDCPKSPVNQGFFRYTLSI